MWQTFKKADPVIKAAIISGIFLLIATIITGTFQLIKLEAGQPSSTPTPVRKTALISTPTPTPTPIPPAFMRGSFSASSESPNKVSLSVTPGDLLIVAITQYERTLLGSNPVTDNRGDQYQEAGNLIANPN